jgi:hypothetical protein
MESRIEDILVGAKITITVILINNETYKRDNQILYVIYWSF